MRRIRKRSWISKLLIAAMLVQMLASLPDGVHGYLVANAVGEQEASPAGGFPMSVASSVYSAPDAYPGGVDGEIGDYRWEQVTGTQLDGSPLEGQQTLIPDARHSAAMAYDEHARNVVMFGGQTVNNYDLIHSTGDSIFGPSPDVVDTVDFVGNASGLVNDTWIWDGRTKEWQEVNLASGAEKPSARKGAAIAYDPATGRVLLFGGQGSSGALNDTWVWDGDSQEWHEVVTGAAPDQRSYAQMAYYYDDEGDGKVVLFGGISGSSIRGDTWVWDGEAQTWTEQAPAAHPPALYAGTMAFDGSRAVLFGGNMGPGSGHHGITHELSNTELWQWDGETWSSERGPENFDVIENNARVPMDYGRWGHAMAYDGRRTIYYGGMTEWVVGTSDWVMRQTRPTDGITYIDYNIGNPYTVFSRHDGEWEPAWIARGSGYYAYLEAGYYPDVPLWPYEWATPRTYASMAFDGTNFVLFGGIKAYMTVFEESVAPGGTLVTDREFPVSVTNETWTFGYTPPTPPLVRINEPIVTLLDKDTREDRVSVITDVYGDGTRPIVERGLQYREYRAPGEPEADWTTVKVTGADATAMGAVTVHLDNTPAANTLEWQVEYELRAYAVNDIGTGYSPPVRFTLEDDGEMEEPDVSYLRVGPAFLHTGDRKRMVAIGKGVINLLRKPADQIHYYLRKGSDTYPLSYRINSDSELELTWTDDLEPGTYDLMLEHAFYDDAEFPGALTITSLDFYKPRNFGTVEVDSASAHNRVDKLVLRGLFAESPDAPGLYTLGDLAEPVAINESVMFKGTALEVDKRTAPHTIRGNGRLYVNSVGSSGAALSYTLYEGEFEVTADDFSLAVPDNETRDYLGMGFQVNAASVVFTKTGVSLSGTIDLGFLAGDQQIEGVSPLEGLAFNRNRFELSGSFPIDRPFAVGPLESSGMTWNIDSRFGYASATSKAQLSEYDIRFDMHMNIRQSRLDGISFGMYRNANLSAAGTELHYLFGSASDLARHSQLPQTFRFSGAASDVFTPELNGLSLIEAHELELDVSKYGYNADGDMYLYWFPVADLEQMVVLNPQAAGIRGLTSGGFAGSGNLNAFDLFVGPMTMSYVDKLGFLGQMKATVNIPKQIPVVGGKTLRSVPVSIDAQGMYSSFKVGETGVKVTYLFSKNVFAFELASPPPKKSTWMKVLSVLDTINTFADALDGDIEAGLDLFDMFTGSDRSLFRQADMSGVASILSARAVPFAQKPITKTGGDRATMSYEQKLMTAATHPGADEAAPAAARLDGSLFAAIVRVTSPDAELLTAGPAGHKVAYTFEIERPYEAMLTLEGDRRDVRLTGPSGQIVEPNDENAAYRDGMTYLRTSFGEAGTWRLTSPEAVRLTVYECPYLPAGGDMVALADAWTAVSDRDVTMYPMKQRGRVLLTVDGAQDAEVVYKTDGRPYALETDEHAPDWNAYRDPLSGRLYVLADVTEPGDWLVDGGGTAEVAVYNVKPQTTMSEVREWVRDGSYPTYLTIPAPPNGQALLVVYGADEHTVVLKPDGSEYELKTDYRYGDWNAYYDDSRMKLTVLVSGASAGEWTIRGGGFADVTAYSFDVPLENLRPLYLKGERTRTIRAEIPEPGSYMLAVIGGDGNTQITAPGAAAPMRLVFEDGNPAQNAILQRWEDRRGPNDGALAEAAVRSDIPDPGERDVLYVTLNVEEAGAWSVTSDNRIELMITELPKLPELGGVDARPAGTNRFEVQWNVSNAEPGTEVVVMVTDDPERPIGEVVAEGLPAAGVRMIDIPSGFVPGPYYLSVMARGAEWAPMVQIVPEPVQLTSAQTLSTPPKPKLVSTGNGALTLQLQPVDDPAVSHYRVFALKDGVPDYSRPAFDAAPDKLELVMTGLETEQMYRFAVMAVGEKDGETAISLLSEQVDAYLPEPRPAALEVGLTGIVPVTAPVEERMFTTYYDEQEKLLLTSAKAVSVQVGSSQAAQLALYVNGQFTERRSVSANGTAAFDLNALLGTESLKERDYELLVEAVNAAGDRSFGYARLYVDRTGPYLYAAYADDPEERLNGLILDAKRVPLVGQAEVGSKLTVDGTRVPLDEAGRFLYFAPWPEEAAQAGKYAVHMIAQDEAGNKTESMFEALLSGGEPAERDPAELAALTLERGVLDIPFHPETESYATEQTEGPLKLFAVPASGDATVTVNGQAPDADGAVEVSIPPAGRLLTVQVKGAGGSEKTYTVQVNAQPSNLALLNALELSADGESVPLNPGFDGVRDSYAAAVGYETSRLSIVPTALEPGSAIHVNGKVVPSGTAVAVELAAGAETTVDIDVTSPAGQAAKRYSLAVWRGVDGNAQLKELSVAGGRLMPVFDSAVTDYRITVPEDAASVRIAAQAASEEAVVTIDGAEGQAADVELTRNVQLIEVSVAAPSGRVLTYRITVQRQSTKDSGKRPPWLAQLETGQMLLEEPFSPYRANYKAMTTAARASLTVRADDPQAIVTVNGRATSDRGSASVDLAMGANAIVVRVESADRSASRSYSIEVERKRDRSGGDNVRTVPVQTGAQNGTVVSVVRSLTENGVKIDTVSVGLDKAREIVEQALADGLGYARIIVTELAGDPADEYVLEASPEAVSVLADAGIRLILSLPNVEIALPQDAIRGLQAEETGLYFRVVPIRDDAQQAQVERRMLADELVRTAAGGKEVIRVGMPMTIETNYAGHPTQVTFPLGGLALPEDEAEANRALDPLAVYIEHSDGERALGRGTIRRDAAGQPEGIEIEVDKFSVFTVIRTVDGAEEAVVLEPYIAGYPDGTFRPGQPLTRAEMAAMLARSLAYRGEEASNAQEDAPGETPYSDVPGDHWASAAIVRMREQGLMIGGADGRFRPSDVVTRAEMAAIAVRWSGWTEADALAGFADASGHWAESMIARADAEGLMQGYPDGTFRPSAPLLRAEAVRVMNRLFDRPIPANAGYASWPDVPASHWAHADIESASGRIRLYPDGSAQAQRSGE